jgi:protein phosphatase
VALGLLASEDAKHHPMRHIVTRAVSGDAAMIVDIVEFQVAPGDRVLLCSDGVHAFVPDEELNALATANDRPLAELCKALVDAANREGGSDNSTAILIAIKQP